MQKKFFNADANISTLNWNETFPTFTLKINLTILLKKLFELFFSILYHWEHFQYLKKRYVYASTPFIYSSMYPSSLSPLISNENNWYYDITYVSCIVFKYLQIANDVPSKWRYFSLPKRRKLSHHRRNVIRTPLKRPSKWDESLF